MASQLQRRCGRRALWVVALATALCSVVACGHETATGNSNAADPSASSITKSQSSQLSAEVLDFFFPATGAEFTAGAQFEGTKMALESDIQAGCMERYGFSVSRSSAAAEAQQFFDNSQFPDLAEISRTGILNPGLLAPFHQPPALPPAEQRAYNVDLKRCLHEELKPFTPLLKASGTLAAQWLGIVSRTESSAAVQAALDGFRSCIERAGVPAGSVNSSSSAGSFNGFLAWETGLESHAKNGTARIAIDRHWAHAFVRCARTTVAVQERLQSGQRAKFLQENFQQVQALGTLAGRTVTKVEQQVTNPGNG